MLSGEAANTNYIVWFDPNVAQAHYYPAHESSMLIITPPMKFYLIMENCSEKSLFTEVPL
jgi:hypothetical protein